MNLYHIQIGLYYMYTVIKNRYNTLKTWINYESLRYITLHLEHGTYNAVYKFQPLSITTTPLRVKKAYLELDQRDVLEHLKRKGVEWNFFGQEVKYQDLFPWDPNDILVIETDNCLEHMFMWDDIISQN